MNYIFALCLVLVSSIGCKNQTATNNAAAPALTSAGAEQTPPPPPPSSQQPAVPLPASPTPAAKPVPAQIPDVVARVNGDPVGKAEFEEAVRNVESQAGGPVPPQRRDEVYRMILDQVIGYRLLIQEARARNIVAPPAEITAEVDKIRKQFPTEAAFAEALKGRGMTLEQLQTQIREMSMVNQLLGPEVSAKSKVQPAEIQKFYEENKARFKQEESVRASHILITVPKDATPEVKEKAKAQAEALLKQAQGGADFAALAKANSQDPGSAQNGGDLGFFSRGRMVPPFETAAFALEPGGLSGVVETPFGYHIIKVMEKKPARQMELAEVSQDVGKYLEQQRGEELTRVFVNGLRAKGKVEVFI